MKRFDRHSFRHHFHRPLADLLQAGEKRPQLLWVLAIGWVLLIGGIAFLWHLGSIGLIDETEPLFAEAARQMTVTGDWITPKFNGADRFDKPPLIYWLMAIAYQTIGVNEWAARLPSALAAIAVMGMIFYTLRRFGEFDSAHYPRRAWLTAGIGAAVVALNPLMMAWGRTGVSDLLLTACIGLALLSFFCGYASHDPDAPPKWSRWYIAFYSFVSLAVLTKGPIGIVLPCLIIGSFLIFVGQFRSVWQEMRPLWGLLIVLAIALPWYIAVTLVNGEKFIDSFFGYHNLERFTSVVNRHKAPWHFFFEVTLVGFAPWSIYLPWAIGRLKVWQRSRWRRQARPQHLGLFALFWFVGVFGFFTISVTKLPSYLLPAIPAAAILVALIWTGPVFEPPQSQWALRLSAGLNALMFFILAVVLLAGTRWIKPAVLRQSLESAGVLVWGSVVALLTAGAIGVLLWRYTRWIWLVNVIAILTLAIVSLMPAMFLVDAERQLPLRQLSQVAGQVKQTHEPILSLGFEMPSVAFYTQQRIKFIGVENVSTYLRQRRSLPSILVLGEQDDIAALSLQPHQYQTIAAVNRYRLIRVPQAKFSQVKSPMQ